MATVRRLVVEPGGTMKFIEGIHTRRLLKQVCRGEIVRVALVRYTSTAVEFRSFSSGKYQ